MTQREESRSTISQAGALPYRQRGGHFEVLLITNSNRSHWIVPKGNLEPGLAPADVAANEAWEEAGVRGEIERHIIASYAYRKRQQCYVVDLYPLRVSEILDVWPEMSRRQRRWVTLDDATLRVEIRGLRLGIDALHEFVERRRVA